MKGQARKAKAAAAAKATTSMVNNNVRFTIDNGKLISAPNNSVCHHGSETNKIPDVCAYFINTFFKCFISIKPKSLTTMSDMMNAVATTLETTYNKFPEALNNEDYRGIVKKNLVSNGVTYLLGEHSGPSNMSLACVNTLMLIDSYDPSSPVPAGTFDARDAKNHLRNSDIISGCTRSLVKYFVNQIPCNCLDEVYSQVKSTTPKIGKCQKCKETKARSSLYICTGCERIQYCSKACQMADVSRHKEHCKILYGR